MIMPLDAPRLALLGALLIPITACQDDDDEQPSASGSESESETGPDLTEPMGERPELGAACETPPVATGTLPIQEGHIMANIVGFDQYGEEIDLYRDLCDKTVLVVRAGFDCGGCNTNAPLHQELYAAYRDQGLVVITLLHDYTQDIGLDQQNIWANQYALEHPVLADNEQLISSPLWPDELGRPMERLLGPGAVLLHGDPSHEDVIAHFE